METLEATTSPSSATDSYINQRLSELVADYKARIRQTGNKEELYKWQLIQGFHQKWNVNATDLKQMLISINFSNLVYYQARGVMVHIAGQHPEEVRNAFLLLFDEQTELRDRITGFQQIIRQAYNNMGYTTFGTHQDERTIATYLAFHSPDKYTFYKYSFYSKLCKILGRKVGNSPENYLHYLEFIKDFVNSYILPDQELLQLKQEFLEKQPSATPDENHLILAQDILYQMLDQQHNTTCYWRIGTSDEDGNYWQLMRDNGYVSIGWPEIGDLAEKKVSSEKDVADLLNASSYNMIKGVVTKKANEIFNFYQKIKEGDIVVAQNGHKVLGIGRVEDEYQYNDNHNFPHMRPVKWLLTDIPDFTSSDGSLTSVKEITSPGTIGKIVSLLKNPPVIEEEPQQKAKNVILYGPPGTGKTYNTAELAVRIINPSFSGTQHEVKEEYDLLQHEGQIEFVTFHQNYSYEDFMVGLRPDINNQNLLRFEERPGLFYQIAKKARDNYFRSRSSYNLAPAFDDILTYFLKPLIENEQEIEVKMKSKSHSFWLTEVDDDSSRISFRKQSGGTAHKINISTLRGLYEGKATIHSQGLGTYYFPLLEELRSKGTALAKQAEREKLKRYVLIIDEINRANISRVFGELITLLEEDKRLGADNELRVTLPNGEKNFTVPSNLYIIGTMNTADKSISLVDIALRRRFEFRGYYPTEVVLTKLVTEKKLTPEAKALLQTVNQNIYNRKKSADFLIGHAYLINKENNELEQVIKNRFVPLLMEYFSGNSQEVANMFEKSDYLVRFDVMNFGWQVNQLSN